MTYALVLPLYNKKEHINRSIESALNQTIPFDEIIIVDDGSTDNWEEVFKFKNNEILKIIHQNNSGPLIARLNGCNTSKSDYICLLDADDYLDPLYLEKIKLYNSNYEIICMAHKEVNGSYEKYYVYNKMYFTENILCEYAKRSKILNSSCICIKKDIISSLKPIEYRTGEDIYMWLEILDKRSGVYINESLVFIDKGAFNRSTNDSIHYPLLLIENDKKYLNIIKNNLCKQKIIRRLYLVNSYVSFKKGNILNAAKYFYSSMTI
jgi:glycosyltransferase involved in cell wall biosynthesis